MANTPRTQSSRSRCGDVMRLAKMSKAPPLYVATVDDDEAFCRALGRLLRAAGMQPIPYVSAEAFLADTKHPQFDCLVLDVNLGGMSGIELGRRLVAEGCSTPFICLADSADPGVSARSRSGRLRGILSKDRVRRRRPRRNPPRAAL